MIDLKKGILPQAIEVGGSFYPIQTDFKYFLRLRELLQNPKLPITDFDFMYKDRIPPSRLEGLRALCEFMNPPRTLPRKTRAENTDIVIDFEIDADLIFAAFYDQYKINLITKKMHWYEFNALLDCLHDTELNRVISYRLWKNEGKNDSYSKNMQKLHEAWRLDQPEDKKDDEALNDFMAKL